MRALIKLGGTLLDSTETRTRLAGEIAQAIGEGVEGVIVHGGGKQMTRYLADRGVETQFIHGLRVTTPEVLDAVLKVFAGSVNKELVAALIAAGVRAVGLSGMDALLTEACRMNEELGYVGRPVRSNPELLNLLLRNSFLPVVACVAGDRSGRYYNVNADQMAVSLACAMQADKLLFLTDVDGVRDAHGEICSRLDLQACQNLIDTGIATGGMRAKLEAASEAIRSGLAEAIIAPGASLGIVRGLLAGHEIGTRLVG